MHVSVEAGCKIYFGLIWAITMLKVWENFSRMKSDFTVLDPSCVLHIMVALIVSDAMLYLYVEDLWL